MAHNFENVDRALKTRLYNHKVDGVWCPIEAPDPDCIRLFSPFISALKPKKRPPMDFATFLLHAPAHKRKLYRKVVEELEIYPLRPKDANIKAFIKEERYVGDVFTLPGEQMQTTKDPRIIQPPDVRFHVSFARFVMSFEKSVYRDINRVFGSHTVMKGLNFDQTGAVIAQKWSTFTSKGLKPVWIALDASRFSGHVSAPIIDFVHRLYMRYIGGRPEEVSEFKRLCKMRVNAKGTVKFPTGVGKYDVKGKLCDGSADTGLIAVITVCAMFYTLLNDLKVAYEFVDCGDDCGIIVASSDVSLVTSSIPTFTKQFGFEYKIEDVIYEFNKIKFCQCHPIYNDIRGVYTMTRDPRVVLAKDGFVLHPNCTPDYAMGILKGVAAGGLAGAGDMPILGVFYQRLSVLTANFKLVREFNYVRDVQYAGMNVGKHTSDQMRLQYFLAFGLDVGMQLEIEQHINTDWELDFSGDDTTYAPYFCK